MVRDSFARSGCCCTDAEGMAREKIRRNSGQWENLMKVWKKPGSGRNVDTHNDKQFLKVRCAGIFYGWGNWSADHGGLDMSWFWREPPSAILTTNADRWRSNICLELNVVRVGQLIIKTKVMPFLLARSCQSDYGKDWWFRCCGSNYAQTKL